MDLDHQRELAFARLIAYLTGDAFAQHMTKVDAVIHIFVPHTRYRCRVEHLINTFWPDREESWIIVTISPPSEGGLKGRHVRHTLYPKTDDCLSPIQKREMKYLRENYFPIVRSLKSYGPDALIEY